MAGPQAEGAGSSEHTLEIADRRRYTAILEDLTEDERDRLYDCSLDNVQLASLVLQSQLGVHSSDLRLCNNYAWKIYKGKSLDRIRDEGEPHSRTDMEDKSTINVTRLGDDRQDDAFLKVPTLPTIPFDFQKPKATEAPLGLTHRPQSGLGKTTRASDVLTSTRAGEIKGETRKPNEIFDSIDRIPSQGCFRSASDMTTDDTAIVDTEPEEEESENPEGSDDRGGWTDETAFVQGYSGGHWKEQQEALPNLNKAEPIIKSGKSTSSNEMCKGRKRLHS